MDGLVLTIDDGDRSRSLHETMKRNRQHVRPSRRRRRQFSVRSRQAALKFLGKKKKKLKEPDRQLPASTESGRRCTASSAGGPTSSHTAQQTLTRPDVRPACIACSPRQCPGTDGHGRAPNIDWQLCRSSARTAPARLHAPSLRPAKTTHYSGKTRACAVQPDTDTGAWVAHAAGPEYQNTPATFAFDKAKKGTSYPSSIRVNL